MNQWWMWDRNCHANYRCQIDLTMNRGKCDDCTLNHVLLAFNLIMFSPHFNWGNCMPWSTRWHAGKYCIRSKCVGVNKSFFFLFALFFIKNLYSFLFLIVLKLQLYQNPFCGWHFGWMEDILSNCFDFIVACTRTKKLPWPTILCFYNGTGLTGFGEGRKEKDP